MGNSFINYRHFQVSPLTIVRQRPGYMAYVMLPGDETTGVFGGSDPEAIFGETFSLKKIQQYNIN
ncbi:hypothetical protein DPMN_156205 [Dreissena polymorpha]|uniref:Uncharacterized protein n=1 Tax=Dreissena polymorpha TaxID=45954 RepID=A0A9D4FQA2_DREPO|nr:hypothetical protein DPMN_156205 [Dreissena polymorpha]